MTKEKIGFIKIKTLFAFKGYHQEKAKKSWKILLNS